MAWVGLERYGYLEDAQRLAYRFLYMYVHSICGLLARLTGLYQDDHRLRRLQWRCPGEGERLAARQVFRKRLHGCYAVRCSQAVSLGRRRVWQPGYRLQDGAKRGLRLDERSVLWSARVHRRSY